MTRTPVLTHCYSKHLSSTKAHLTLVDCCERGRGHPRLAKRNLLNASCLSSSTFLVHIGLERLWNRSNKLCFDYRLCSADYPVRIPVLFLRVVRGFSSVTIQRTLRAKEHGSESISTMTTRKRTEPDSPIPSITLQITQKTADLFLQTSDALKKDLNRVIEKKPRSDDGSDSKENEVAPLFEDLYEAMLSSQEEPVVNFVQRLKAASLDENEEKVTAMLFHDSEMNEKLGYILGAIRSGKTQKQTKDDFVSMFYAILAGIMCCCETEKSEFVVEGRPDRADGPPPKRKETEEATESTKPSTEGTSDDKDIRDCQSPSFDSSLATLNDEDHPDGVKKEVSEVANYAADQLISFFDGTAPENISAEKFVDWYRKSGINLAPWMELLSVAKWKSAASKENSTAGAAKQPVRPSCTNGEQKQLDACNKENESNEPDRPQSHPRSSSDGQINMKNESQQLPPPAEKSASREDITLATTKSDDDSPGSLINEDNTSRTLVSFDFSGSDHPTPLCISISEDNLYALRQFVTRTGLMNCPAPEICKRLLKLANRRVFGDEALLTLQRDTWLSSIDKLLGRTAWEQLNTAERAAFSGCFAEIFACYEGSKSFLRSDEVDLQEFAVGFCFFCAGNKSQKLATGFEMLDDKRKLSLSQEELLRYLNSYLTMLVAMSLLKPISQRNVPTKMTEEERHTLRQAVECGSRWTLSHFVKHLGNNDFEARKDSYSFEKFASWYSGGGYEVAPWLELLDLTKVFSLIPSSAPTEPQPSQHAQAHRRRDRVSSLRRHHSSRRGLAPEILFTFPLANQSSLVVLKDDAYYVRGVVEELGLLSMNPDDLWASLSSTVQRMLKGHTVSGGAVYVGMTTFVEAMQSICPTTKTNGSSPITELAANFFQCFDLENNDNVALDELMGGLTLLCGGKKSHKLAFAFGVFDTRPGIQEKKRKEGITHSLSGEDLFLFLRSILIVTFSCCRQSLDMTDGMVARCIADTANMICNDVMRHQWERRHKDRLNFDEFGQWYNDGGYERAPWLELLDLKKWVLVDGMVPEPKRMAEGHPAHPQRQVVHRRTDQPIPPPPPEDALDADFFENSIMPMDSVSVVRQLLGLKFGRIARIGSHFFFI